MTAAPTGLRRADMATGTVPRRGRTGKYQPGQGRLSPTRPNLFDGGRIVGPAGDGGEGGQDAGVHVVAIRAGGAVGEGEEGDARMDAAELTGGPETRLGPRRIVHAAKGAGAAAEPRAEVGGGLT